jgi:D-proline reductase (dithiol) PrdB
MAELADLPLWEQVFLKTYPFRKSPWSSPAPMKPLREAKAALVTTAALHLPEQAPFDSSVRGGDRSYRWIPSAADLRQLRSSHRSKSWDREGIAQDPNVCFPLERFRELAAEGVLGSLNHRHLSFMGSITAPGLLLRQTAPEAARELKQDGVDVAFLAPV